MLRCSLVARLAAFCDSFINGRRGNPDAAARPRRGGANRSRGNPGTGRAKPGTTDQDRVALWAVPGSGSGFRGLVRIGGSQTRRCGLGRATVRAELDDGAFGPCRPGRRQERVFRGLCMDRVRAPDASSLLHKKILSDARAAPFPFTHLQRKRGKGKRGTTISRPAPLASGVRFRVRAPVRKPLKPRRPRVNEISGRAPVLVGVWPIRPRCRAQG